MDQQQSNQDPELRLIHRCAVNQIFSKLTLEFLSWVYFVSFKLIYFKTIDIFEDKCLNS